MQICVVGPGVQANPPARVLAANVFGVLQKTCSNSAACVTAPDYKPVDDYGVD